MYPTSGRACQFSSGLISEHADGHLSAFQCLVSAPTSDTIDVLRLHNEYPEISLNALWGKVWYEGCDEPIYSWQSSSADNDFEPKFSLTPLAFGTLKAAFYALLFAVLIAIMGAIYTAYFMAP